MKRLIFTLSALFTLVGQLTAAEPAVEQDGSADMRSVKTIAGVGVGVIVIGAVAVLFKKPANASKPGG